MAKEKEQKSKTKETLYNVTASVFLPQFNTWANKTKEEKRNYLIYCILVLVFFVGGVLTFCFYDQVYGPNSVFYTTEISNPFFRALFQAIPKIVGTLSVIAIALFMLRVFNLIVTFFHFKNQKVKTAANLINSGFRYLIWIVCFLVILYLWGVNTAGLIASASVLTVIIGFGTQSLVEDVVTGVLLVFERDFQVGDWVIIDGFRGEVIEVGLRTTKIKFGDTQIIRNSEIKKVINLTRDPSWCDANFHISNQESVLHAEKALKDALPYISSLIPNQIEPLSILGITKHTQTSFVITLIVTIDEAKVPETRRLLNREGRIALEKAGIKFAGEPSPDNK